MLNSGCGLSASAAYTPVFTVLKFVSQKVTAHCFKPGRTNLCITGVLGVLY